MPSNRLTLEDKKTTRSSALSKVSEVSKTFKDPSIVTPNVPPLSYMNQGAIGNADLIGKETLSYISSGNAIAKSPSGFSNINKFPTVSRIYGPKQQVNIGQQQQPTQAKSISVESQVIQSIPPQTPSIPLITANPGQEENHPIDISMRTGVKFEFAFALIAASIYFGLWIFLMTVKCYQLIELVFWVKSFSLLGTFTSIFVAIYCCFERTLTPRQGITGCLFSTAIVVVGCLNLIGAYLSVGCICKCANNAVQNGGDDLVILILELSGSAFLLAILLVVSLSH